MNSSYVAKNSARDAKSSGEGSGPSATEGLRVDGTFELTDLAMALGRATAGQSNVLSCLYWAFQKYGRLEPPKEGYTAYDDPDSTTAEALLSVARAAADFFGYDIRRVPDDASPPSARDQQVSGDKSREDQ